MKTHRESHRTPEYRAWTSMKSRCCDPSCDKYKWYGARGIRVCAAWVHDYVAFLSYVGRRPSNKHSLDRIDNDKNYEPGNVRWATTQQQMRNRRTARRLTINGVTRLFCEWVEISGLSDTALHSRIDKLKWPLEKAVTHPHRSQLRARGLLKEQARGQYHA